jgi:RNA polymerase sigma-70 factor, ECF subfamily
MWTATDDEIIRRIAGGDRQAMRLLFARYHVRLYRFISRLVNDTAAAEDLMNEVFLEVWRQANRFQGRSSVSTWLYGIARFKALSFLRGRREEALDEDAAAELVDPADNPGTVMEKKDKAELLHACLGRLSAAHRAVVDLVYYHEKSVEEVAEIMGIPKATVKTRMFNARNRLAVLLRAQGVERGWP